MFRLLYVALLVLSLCFMGIPAQSANAAPKTLTYSWNCNVGPLNPHLYSPNQMFAQAMVYDPLVRYDASGEIKPCLAESWNVNDDGRIYTFHLRKGVFFSDKTPLTAAAVKANIDAVLKNRKRHQWLEAVAQIEEARVVDNLTVQLLLKESYYPILQDLALIRPLRMISPKAIPGHGDTSKGIKAPIGTGPWKLAESRLGEYDIFLRNDLYWGKKPDIERIVIKVIPDPNACAVAFETGETDLIYGDGQISLDTYNRFRSNRQYHTGISQPLATRTLAINTNKGVTRDPAVRKAIQHAVDKDALISGVFLNTETRADTLYPTNTPYCNVGLEPYVHDRSLAKKILDDAGWKKTNNAAFRSKNGEALSLELCFVGNNAVMKSLAEVIQSDLRAIGCDARLVGEETDAFYKRQKEGQFNLIFNDTWGPPYEPHSFVSSWRVPSHADFQAQSGLPMKAEIDRKIGEVLVSTDETKRAAIYKDILTTIHDQAVYLPISYTTGLFVYNGHLTNVAYGPTKNEIPFEQMKRVN